MVTRTEPVSIVNSSKELVVITNGKGYMTLSAGQLLKARKVLSEGFQTLMNKNTFPENHWKANGDGSYTTRKRRQQ